MLSKHIKDKSQLKEILDQTTRDIKANRLLMGWKEGFIVNPEMKRLRTTMHDLIFIMQSVENLM